MAGIFDAIPTITIILFALGLVGVMVYERARTKQNEETSTWYKSCYQVSFIRIQATIKNSN